MQTRHRHSLLVAAAFVVVVVGGLLLAGCGGQLTAAPSIAPPPTPPAKSPALLATSSPLPSATPAMTQSVRAVAARFTGPLTENTQIAPSHPDRTPESTTALPTAAVSAPVLQAALPAPDVAASGRSESQLLSRTFYSAALGREMPYFIYLPVGYAESGARYPTLYMLHGYGGSNTEWLSLGFPEEADKEINAGEIPPMLIVFPQGDQAYWVNHAGGELWGDYTAKDVVAQIDATYRTVPDATHRAIGGLSMGAHGAMQLAMNYPDTFSVVGMHSPTLRNFADRFDYFGDEPYFNAHDPSYLVQQNPDRARQLKILMDVGEQDADWHDKTVAFHDLLTHQSIAHQFHTWPGMHDGKYWMPHCRDYLRFYAASLAPA